MPRATNSVASRRRRKKVLKLTKGYWGAKSKLWRRIITDIFNIPTVFLKERTGAPFGDVILAGVATGILKNYSVAKEKAEYIDPIEPINENHEQYMLYFSIYKNLYEHLKEDFKDLARMRKESTY